MGNKIAYIPMDQVIDIFNDAFKRSKGQAVTGVYDYDPSRDSIPLRVSSFDFPDIASGQLVEEIELTRK